MALILLIVIGAILGWLASIITRTEDRNGILTDAAAGVIGSLLAGLLVNKGSIIGGLSATALLAAVAGAVVLLAALTLYQRHRANA
ncbi:GlsB/YeaQ/YmgE family stress response membrane protein [Altererythrobacter arenosus]|uniref:GlsB/YeaQ/YmgE family stress response membrane protein n=1 Tax=Altererythrobacter arenosus TaxID=3032592 RepID=A0ABY8FUP9_9SPHN|nr:GlsB/YeaQ/YmgE family stress response membrane protein [Altererythrobacter sp. CAU 1644]WFL78472.1 GlsB/YeaQ/YmgE family stress response membrane protein [Altererythrobacter sp. CAU 1644]